MDRPCLPPRHHHPDRQRRTARRHRRPATAAIGRTLDVHGSLGPKRPRTHALAADCRPGGTGAGSGHHDGPHHGVGRRDGSEGKDRQCHGAAWNDVSNRHRSWSLARHQHRQCRLADAGAGVQRLLPGSPVDRPRLSPRHHHPDRRCRTARRHHRPPTAAVGRDLPVHGGLGPVENSQKLVATVRG